MAGERTLPGLGLTGFWDLHSAGWKPGMDTNLQSLSAICQLSVLSQTTALPGSPTDGDIYIVPSSDGTNPDKIAIRDNAAWVYFAPNEGFLAFVQDTGAFMYYTGVAWSNLFPTGQIELSAFVSGSPSDGELVFSYIASKAFTLPSGLTGSYGESVASATGSAAFSIKKNGVEVGTATWAASATTATLAMASATAFAAGDTLTITGPATADATLADITFALLGSL